MSPIFTTTQFISQANKPFTLEKKKKKQVEKIKPKGA